MGYARNPATVRKHAERLAPLLAGRSFVWTDEEPQKWAYKVRECLNIAADNPEEFPGLSKIGKMFKAGSVQITTFGKQVQARFIEDLPFPSGTETGRFAINKSSAVEVEKGTEVLDSPANIPVVVDRWLARFPSKAPMLLTNCSFTNAELKQLAAWAKGEGWMVLHQEGQRSVTLAVEDTGVKEEARIMP